MSKLKKILALALGASISITTALSFVGCKVDTKDPVKPGPGIENPDTPIKPDPGDDKPIIVPPVENPDDKEEEAKKEFAAAVKTANDKLAAIETGMNFKYSVVFEDTSKLIAEFDKQNVKLQKDGTTLYYTKDGRVNYEFSLEDGKWQKNITDVDMQGDFAEFVISINRISWTDYDKTKNQLHGTRMGDDVLLKVEQSQVEMLVNYDAKTGKSESEFKLSSFGTTKVTLPEIEATKPPVEAGNVYENGKWNIALLGKTLEKWLKENIDGFTLLTNEDYKVDKLLYINVDEASETYDFAFVSTYKGKESIEYFKFHQRTIDAFTGYSEISVDQAVEILNNIKSTGKGIIVGTNSISPEYSTLTATPEQKAQFDAMTKNIFAELDIDGLDEKNVKLAFKTQHRGVNESASDGYLYSTTWDHYYVVEIDGNLELLKVGVRASTSRNEGEIDNVINHPEWWNINGSPVRTPLQKGNEALYVEAEKEATLTR